MNEFIRPAKAEDASRIAEILIYGKRLAYRKIFRNDNVSFNEMQVLPLALEYRDNPEKLKDVFVFDDGIVRAMMSMRQDGTEMELTELYVDPFFQDMRIGSQMIKDALEKASEAGAETIFLYVLDKNITGRMFYQYHGFESDGKTTPDSSGERVMKYVRKL
ncbi:MAG: GNAT family N-acetyltransferase [Solobacterium sp.]|nr:GNAT family N-acetyltransferase [Solobacterium sp.]